MPIVALVSVQPSYYIHKLHTAYMKWKNNVMVLMYDLLIYRLNDKNTMERKEVSGDK